MVNFNPRTHRGVRQKMRNICDLDCLISIHAPIVGCDSTACTPLALLNYFNPRTHRGVRRYKLSGIFDLYDISIHAPIVGCDLNCWFAFFNSHISIHAPIVGCDRAKVLTTSTYDDFNPRTHRGVRQPSRCTNLSFFSISIHAPIVGCDAIMSCTDNVTIKFQSTHPSWGATLTNVNDPNISLFQSTHPSWGATRLLLMVQGT